MYYLLKGKLNILTKPITEKSIAPTQNEKQTFIEITSKNRNRFHLHFLCNIVKAGVFVKSHTKIV